MKKQHVLLLFSCLMASVLHAQLAVNNKESISVTVQKESFATTQTSFSLQYDNPGNATIKILLTDSSGYILYAGSFAGKTIIKNFNVAKYERLQLWLKNTETGTSQTFLVTPGFQNEVIVRPPGH